MIGRLRLRLGLPWIVTIAALMIAMGGVSYGAAQRYIITSKNQIAPRVRAQLHGFNGAQGPQGPPGPVGPPGSPGAPGGAAPGGGGGGHWGTVIVANGALSIQQTNGGVNVTNPQTGTYCLTVPPGESNNKAISVTEFGQFGIVGQTGVTVCAGAYQVFTVNGANQAVNGNFNYLIP